MYRNFYLTDPKITFLVRFLFFFFSRCSSYPDNTMLVGERISWLVFAVDSKAYLREYVVM